jgi:hypothetical protein
MSEASAYYPSETRVLPLTLIQRERLLPVPGKVLVNAGEHVQPTQIVAQTDLVSEVRLINAARLLRVSPSRAIKYLRVREGDDVTTQTVIAVRGVLPSGRILSPADGFVYRIDRATGRVLIKVTARPLPLTAYLQGAVANVIPNYGVVIETTGAIIQATVGFGEESYGVLQVAANAPTDVLRAKSIDVASHGAIVVGGAWIDESALQQAQQLQARGLIAGSMDGKLLNLARNMPFPILLTEGLGRIPMALPIFKLLQSQSGREASISASTRTRWGVSRPEILIPLPADTKPAAPAAVAMALAVGVRVRVVRGSNQSTCGVVSAIYTQPVQIESGARVHGAEVNLDGVGKTFVPFSNLEIIRV